jgi:hypothetical protein
MKTTKNLFLALALIAGMTFFISCEPEDDFLPKEDPIENPIDTTGNPVDTTTNTVGYVRTYVHEFDFVDISKLQIFKQADGTVDSIFKYNGVDTTFITPEFGKITAKDGAKSAKFSAIESIENVGDYMKITADFDNGFKAAGAMTSVLVEKETGEISNVEETPATDGEYVVMPDNDWVWVDNAGLTVTFSDESSSKTGSVININNAEFSTLLNDNIADFSNATGFSTINATGFNCTKTVKYTNGDVYGYITFLPDGGRVSFVTIVKIISSGSFSLSYVKTTVNCADFNYSFPMIVNDNLDLVSYGYTPDMRSLVKGNKVISQINSGTLVIYGWMKGYIFAPSFTIFDNNSKDMNMFANKSLGQGDGNYINKKLTSKMILFGDYIYYVTEENGSNYVTKVQISNVSSANQLNVCSDGSKIITTAIESVSTTENGYFILTSGTTNYFIYEDGSMTTETATEAGDVINF